MVRSVVSKVMWVARATSTVVGLAIMLALVLGVASMAFGKNGDNFILGQLNKATAITKLNGNVDGSPALQVVNNNTAAGSKALQLGVAQGKPPLVVNATAGKARNLNADKLDGKHATQLGVNGWEIVKAESSFDSAERKGAFAQCPPGKVVVGTGGDIITRFHDRGDMMLEWIRPNSSGTGVSVGAIEDDPTSAEWSVAAFAVCATAP